MTAPKNTAHGRTLLGIASLFTAIALLGWLSQRYYVEIDLTAAKRNTLAAPSRALLERMSGPLRVTAYARDDELLRRGIADLIGRYRRFKPDMVFDFVDPDTIPQESRDARTGGGSLRVEYEGREQTVLLPSEKGLSSALERLLRGGERWLAYLTGHGERDLLGRTNHDFGDWGKQLKSHGFRPQPVNLLEIERIADNAAILIIAAPQIALLPGEADIVADFVSRGGNLLWLLEPGPLRGLESLAAELGIEPQSGVIADPNAKQFHTAHPSLLPITRYANHPAINGFNLITLLPQAIGIRRQPQDRWHTEGILQTGPAVWSETTRLDAAPTFDAESDIEGPFDVGIALRRSAPGGNAEQRIVVLGDSDLFSNQYIGNGGNLELGFKLVNWLSHDDRLIDIPVRAAPDTRLVFGRTAIGIIGVFSLAVLPLLLAGTGAVIWWRRSRR